MDRLRQRARASHLRRRRHPADAVDVRAVRPQSDVRAALRHGAGRAADRRAGRHGDPVRRRELDDANGFGFVVARTPRDLYTADLARRCSTTASRRRGSRCRRTAWPPIFSWERSAREYERVYQSARCDVDEQARRIRRCFDAIAAIWSDEGGASLDDIALMATINSVLVAPLPALLTGPASIASAAIGSIVGPYIGTVGCLQIEFGKGVCGTAAAKRETVIVPDVNAVPRPHRLRSEFEVGDRRAGVRSRRAS